MIVGLTTAAFRISNCIEAGLWITIGIGFAIAAIRLSGTPRRRCWIATVDFILFGISDLVEIQTGAWYRPIWLLVWKGGCLAVFARLLIVYFRDRRGI